MIQGAIHPTSRKILIDLDDHRVRLNRHPQIKIAPSPQGQFGFPLQLLVGRPLSSLPSEYNTLHMGVKSLYIGLEATNPIMGV